MLAPAVHAAAGTQHVSKVNRARAEALIAAGRMQASGQAELWRVQTARKPETRARRIETLVAMLARGDKIHR